MDYVLMPLEDVKEMRRTLERVNKTLAKLEGKVGGIAWKTAQETGLGRERLRHMRETQPEKCKQVKGRKSWLYQT